MKTKHVPTVSSTVTTVEAKNVVKKDTTKSHLNTSKNLNEGVFEESTSGVNTIGELSTDSPKAKIIKIKKMSKKKCREVELAFNLLTVVLIFVLCWLPYCVTMLVTTFTDITVSAPVWTVVLFFGLLNSCCNPIIYGVINRGLRRGYQKFFRSVNSKLCQSLRR